MFLFGALRDRRGDSYHKSVMSQIDKDKSNLDGSRHEYTEVNNTIRNYSVLRFNIFTVFLAALGGLVSVSFKFFEFKYGDENEIMLWGRIGGFLVTLLFYRYELRIQDLIDNSLAIGRELEERLGYNLLTKRPPGGILRTHNANNFFFIILILFWIAMIIDMLIKIELS